MCVFVCSSNKCDCDCVIVSLSFCGFDVLFHPSSFFLCFFSCLLNSLYIFGFNHFYFQFVQYILQPAAAAATAWNCNIFALPPFIFYWFKYNNKKNQVKKKGKQTNMPLLLFHIQFFFSSVCILSARLKKNKMMLILNVNHQQNEKLPHKLMQINLFYYSIWFLFCCGCCCCCHSTIALFFNDNLYDLMIKMMPELRWKIMFSS